VASRRTHLGLRRGGSRLRSLPARPLTAALVGAALLLGGCNSAQEQAKLELHEENCQNYYQQGEFFRALQQAELALSVDQDNVTMRIARGLCLLRIAKGAGDTDLLDQSIDVFDELIDDVSVDEEYQAYLGHGSAHLQRFLALDGSIGQLQSRVDRGFLDEVSQAQEERLVARHREMQAEDLEVAEESFREVLSLETHAENSYAMVDLVLVLNAGGEKHEDMVELANKALALLDENNVVNGRMLENSAGLPTATKLALERRIETNGAKEQALRDLLATVYFNKGELVPALEQLTLLADRGLMGEAQYYNRAEIYEQLGRFDLAVADLQSFMRMRSGYLTYEEDTLAPEIFRRIDELRAADAAALRRR